MHDCLKPTLFIEHKNLQIFNDNLFNLYEGYKSYKLKEHSSTEWILIKFGTTPLLQ